MLPFPRPLVYGNVINPAWYSGSNVIAAFDTNNFVASTGVTGAGFSDYKGITWGADYQTSGLLPAKATSSNSTLNSFGSYGIILYGSAISAFNSQIPSALTQQDYTVDFWFRNTSATALGTSGLEFIPLAWYNVMSNNSNKYTLWYYFKDTAGPRYQNNGTNTNRTATLYSTLYNSATWKHYAYTFVKSTNTIYVFIDGTLIDSFVLNVANPGTASSHFCVGGHVNNTGATGGTAPHTAIDRFRVRNTAVWTSNFNTSTIYP